MKKAKGIVWDLTDLYSGATDPALEQAIKKAVNDADEFQKKYHGRIAADDSDDALLLQAIQDYEQIIETIYRPYAMASLLFSGDGRNDTYKALIARVQETYTGIENKTLFFALEIQKLSDERLQQLLEGGKLDDYEHYIRTLRLFTDHTLTEQEEQLINHKDLTGKTAFVNLFDEFTAAFEWQFEMDGKTKTLTQSEIRELFYNQDREVRRRAKIAHDMKYGENALIFTNIFGNLIKDHGIETRLRGYESPIQPSYLRNKVQGEIVETMLGVVKEHYPLAQEYFRIKARLLGLPKLKGSDVYAPVTKSERAIKFAEGRALVEESFQSFSPEFGDIIKSAFTKNWIDAEVRPGKRGGAFCMSIIPSLHPYVLMSYVDNLNSVYTLAHELGHALHGVLAAEKQSILTYHPPLVLAETASVFAEMLLTRRLREEELDRDTRIHMLASKLEDFFATISRQTMYIQFELDVHKEGAQRRLSTDDFSRYWVSRRDEMYGDSIDFLDEEKWYWAVIPHFIHTRFYCYAYTFGALFVLALYNRYLEQGEAFVPKYRALLAAGDSTWPENLVKSVGMDFSTAEFWEGGFTVLDNMVKELQELSR